MVPVAILLCWAGYAVGYYGADVITGGNDSFVALVWPGRYKAVPRDAAGGSTSSGTATKSPSPAKKAGAVGGILTTIPGPLSALKGVWKDLFG